MTLDADQIVDRRRLRRKLSFWRVAAFVLLALAVIAAIGTFGGTEMFSALAPPVSLARPARATARKRAPGTAGR